MQQSDILGEIKTALTGQYRIQTVEGEIIKELRRRVAYDVLGEEIDGSASSWVSLPDFKREIADSELSRLVLERKDELDNEQSTNVVSDTGLKKNLILDSGLNYLCSTTTDLSFDSSSVALGLGTTATYTDSASVTATTSGTSVIASGSIFTVDMVGALIKWDSGEEAYISAFTSDTQVTIGTSVTANTTFTVWYVNQTALSSPSVTSSTRIENTTSRSGVTVVRTCGYDFAVEVSNKVYTEGGFIIQGSTLFSRFLIDGGSVTVLIGQQARMYYILSINASNTVAASTSWTLDSYDSGSPGGWDTPAGQHHIVSLRGIDGLAQYHGASLLPSIDSGSDRLYISTTSSLLGFNANTSVDVSGAIGTYASGSLASYTSGNFYRDSSYYFSAAHSNTSSIRSVFLCSYYGKVSWQFLFDSAKTKDDVHSLTLKLRRSLSRTLTNP